MNWSNHRVAFYSAVVLALGMVAELGAFAQHGTKPQNDPGGGDGGGDGNSCYSIGCKTSDVCVAWGGIGQICHTCMNINGGGTGTCGGS